MPSPNHQIRDRRRGDGFFAASAATKCSEGRVRTSRTGRGGRGGGGGAHPERSEASRARRGGREVGGELEAGSYGAPLGGSAPLPLLRTERRVATIGRAAPADAREGAASPAGGGSIDREPAALLQLDEAPRTRRVKSQESAPWTRVRRAVTGTGKGVIHRPTYFALSRNAPVTERTVD